MEKRRAIWAAAINWTLAILSVVALGLCFYSGRRAADEAVRTYGHNVDSGAYIILAGVIFFAPAALFFTIAGTAWWSQWRLRWLFQAAAIAWMLLPVIGILRV